jgi:hypothetical protein
MKIKVQDLETKTYVARIGRSLFDNTRKASAVKNRIKQTIKIIIRFPRVAFPSKLTVNV